MFAGMPEPPLGVLFERKTARPSNQHISQLLVKVCELIQQSGARRFADVGSAEIASFSYDDRCRRFDSEEEARRWLFQFSSPPAKH